MTKLEAILEKFERLRSRQKQVLREIQRAAKEESVSEEEAERVFAEVAEKYKGTLERLERYDRGEVNENLNNDTQNI